MPTQRRPKAQAAHAAACVLAFAFAFAFASGCAGNPTPAGSRTGANLLAAQLTTAQAIQGVRISFHHSDYYTLTRPNGEACAGDARNFYDPIAAVTSTGSSEPSYGFDARTTLSERLSVAAGTTGNDGPLKLPADTINSDETLKPSFIKNVSVDITDANANVTGNLASSCSLGQGVSVPAPSSCATFDYGAIGGIPTTLGGTMLVIGGTQSYNYAGILPASLQTSFPPQGVALSCGPTVNTATLATGTTACFSGTYALGVNTLPASAFESDPALMPAFNGTSGPTEAVSMWANLGAVSGYAGPTGGAGASASYDEGLQKVLLFGGVAPLAGLGSDAPGVTSYDTWSYDLKSQQWTMLTANIYVEPRLQKLFDTFVDIEGPYTSDASVLTNFAATPVTPLKPSGPRALQGYISMPGMGIKLNSLNATGAMTSTASLSTTMIDPTERLMIVGGYGGTGSPTAMGGTHRFNPTYGPEIVNTIQVAVSPFNLTNAGLGTADTTTASSAYLYPVQWLDSYPIQLTTNSYGAAFKQATSPAVPANSYSGYGSLLAPDLPPISMGPTGGQSIINIAFAPVFNNTAVGGGMGVPGTGYILAAGGFDAAATRNLPDTTIGDDFSRAGCTLTASAVAAQAVTTTYPYGTNTNLTCGGGLSMQTRFFGGGLAQTGIAREAESSYWSSVPNFIDPNAHINTPSIWTQIPEAGDGGGKTVPLLGGASMLPGFNLQTNDVVHFGGLDCRSYVSDSAATCIASTTNTPQLNTGRYWRFTTNPANTIDESITPDEPTSVIPTDDSNSWNSTAANLPVSAGMATARGVDPGGKVVILAWGGAKSAAATEGLNAIYYLYAAATLGSTTNRGDTTFYKWGKAMSSNARVQGNVPAELINASMVYSHVTGKFYVFGGYEPSVSQTRANTYEITLSCTLVGGHCQTTSYVFTWRQLNTATGTSLTCYPTSCPSARRSHRMAEVNYYNRNPGGDNRYGLVFSDPLTHGTNGEQTCTSTAPCSYGIFMEGGTPDGLTYLADRWMFDPTANGGNGHWQLMNDLPPRALAAMASVDLTLADNGKVVHRAVMFGGETGMHDAQAAKAGNFFVPPTLGDTWMFDYDVQTWNRVELLGKGYIAATMIPGSAAGLSLTEFDRRQAFNSQSPASLVVAGANGGNPYNLGVAHKELSPPPLSGAMMVTRTHAPPIGGTNSATSPLRKLNLPEVYMIGGRLKDGSFSTIKNVYKFCAGSTGEAWVDDTVSGRSVPNVNDYSCDAYDATNNASSPSPSAKYVGRWLTKNPDAITAAGAAISTTPEYASYLGAASYDSIRDRVIVFGGLSSLNLNTTTAVTDTASRIATADLWEYTPPQPQLDATTLSNATVLPREGRWTYVPACAGYDTPEGRYGHSMAYNTLGQNVVIMGGYSADGTPLTRQIADPSSNTTYTAPDIWTGTYCDSANCSGKLPSDTSPAPSLTNFPCYFWKPVTTFGNSTVIQSQLPPQTGIAHAASVYVPATGYNLGFYSTLDTACAGSGPLASNDTSLNKLLAGGAYIDLDREQLGANENLLLNISYLPMGKDNRNPDGSIVGTSQAAAFRIHLMKTNQTALQLQGTLQPRYLAYSDPDQYPKIVQSLSVMAPPSGQMAQEQVLIPISIDPGIDRIRIERYSGSAILLDAELYRMGSK